MIPIKGAGGQTLTIQLPKQMAFKHSEKEVFDEQNEPSGEVTFIYSM